MWVKLFDKAYTSLKQEQDDLGGGVNDIISQLGKKKTIETEEL